MITNAVAVNPVSLASEEDTQGQYRRGSHVRTSGDRLVQPPAEDHLEPPGCEQDWPAPVPPETCGVWGWGGGWTC